MVSLADLVPPPEDRKALTVQSFLVDVLPVFLCYYSTAVLALIPGTFRIRLALLPITLWSAFHAATKIDIVLAYNEPGLIYWNQGFCVCMVSVGMRAIEWTFRMKPMKRVTVTPLRPGKERVHHIRTPDESSSVLKKAVWDALELMFNLRGCGWDWSEGLYIPPATRRTDSTPAFLLITFFSMIKNGLLVDGLLYLIQSFSPSTFGSPAGGTIFDTSMPPLLRYTRSSLISLLSCLIIYCVMQGFYDVFTLIGILLFGQNPSQWPRLFCDPWRSVSLSELWAKRWHQLFRSSFVSLGSKPLFFLIGPVGKVMGAFLVSGLLHFFGLWGMGRGTEFWSVGGFFLMMGVGVLLEGIWKKVLGTRIGGTAGWMWTMLWCIGWSNILMDAWFRRGLAGGIFFPQTYRPSKLLVTFISGLYPSQ